MLLAAYDTFNLLLPKMTLLPKIICYSNVTSGSMRYSKADELSHWIVVHLKRISGAIPLEKSQQYFAGQTSKFFLNLADVQKE